MRSGAPLFHELSESRSGCFFLSLKRAIMIVVILKEYLMKGNAFIRKMIESDIKHLSQGFINQGWTGREEILARYFLEQERGGERSLSCRD